MLPASMAIPSAGRTVPSTLVAGICTTKMSSEVRVGTLNRMLKPSPKNALVSPRVHHGILSESSDVEDLNPVRFMGLLLCGAVRVWGEMPAAVIPAAVMRECGDSAAQHRLTQCLQQGRGIGDPPEDPPLGRNHFQADALELREIGADAIGEHERVIAAVVGLPHRGVYTDFGRDTGDDQMGDPRFLEDGVEFGRVEGALAGLVDDDLPLDRRQLVDDVVPVLAADEDAAVRADITNSLRRLATLQLCGWTIRQVRQVALSGVDH